MKKARIQIAKPDIIKYFDESPQRVFKLSDIARILVSERGFWRLAQSTTTQNFIDFLTKHGKLTRLSFPFPYRKEHRYVWGHIPLLEVLLTLKAGAYYTHYTAVRMHGLTEQVPKTIYLNHEQRPHIASSNLEQERIDAAFSRAARVSNNVITFQDYRICLVNGMHTDQLGVIEENVQYDSTENAFVRFTNLERTLIDIVVRPNYAGGASEVLKAFVLAKGRVSVNKLVATLKKLNYVYPYHQAIGFYLQRAEYSNSAINLVREIPIRYNFYLHHKLGDTSYVDEWKLFVPKGF